MISSQSSLPGDLKTLEILINGKNITNFITQTYIFVSITESSWNCQLFVNDTNNLLENCPIKHGSSIEINVETSIGSSFDGKKTFKFIMNSIKDRKMINAKHYNYTIQGITTESLKNQGVRVSHAYKNESPTNIIKKLIEDYLKAKIDKVDDCDNTITHFFTNTTPIDCAYQMCKIGVVDKAADLLLYQVDDGKFSCRSIEKLYSDEKSKLKFKIQASHYRNESGNLEGDVAMISHKHEWEHCDVMANSSSGMMANKTVSFDCVSKTWTETIFKYGDDTEKDAENKQWEDDKLFEQENVNISFHPVNKLMHENETMYDTVKDWAGSRKSALMKLENDKLLIQCPFTAKVVENLGKNCEVEIPTKHDENDSGDEFNGTFLITEMCFILSPKGAFTNYGLIKKRVEKKNNNPKQSATTSSTSNDKGCF